jgi:hypothetical protein
MLLINRVVQIEFCVQLAIKTHVLSVQNLGIRGKDVRKNSTLISMQKDKNLNFGRVLHAKVLLKK